MSLNISMFYRNCSTNTNQTNDIENISKSNQEINKELPSGILTNCIKNIYSILVLSPINYYKQKFQTIPSQQSK